jgi:ankyrin repeat protein
MIAVFVVAVHADAADHNQQALSLEKCEARCDKKNSILMTKILIDLIQTKIQLDEEIDELLQFIPDVNVRMNEIDRTPCHIAASCNQGTIIEILIKKGANPNAKDLHGNTPLHVACAYNSLSATTALLKCGANTQERNKEGKTPLDYARKKNYYDIVHLIEEYERSSKTFFPFNLCSIFVHSSD